MSQGPAGDADGPAAVDYRALARFRHELRKFAAFSEAAADAAGLTPQQHQALLAIKGLSEDGGLTVGELAGILFIRHQTAVELVDRMAGLGLVRRAPDPADRRRVRVELTTLGGERLSTLSAVHVAEIRAIVPTLMAILKSFAGTP